MRRAAKRDASEAAIVDALRAVGATVVRTDWCDLTVGFRGRNFALECKTGKGKLTRSQTDLLRTWAGHYDIVRTPEDALAAIGVTTCNTTR